MADWKTYAKAAGNTARKQGAAARSSASVYTRAARSTAQRQAPEAQRAIRRSRDGARRTAAAYTVVAGRRARRARLGQRLKNAFRDAVLVGASLGAIWFIVTRTGAQIPFTAVAAVILVLMVVRFGYALFARTDTTVDEDNDLAGGFGERWDSADDDEREFDPREAREHEARAREARAPEAAAVEAEEPAPRSRSRRRR